MNTDIKYIIINELQEYYPEMIGIFSSYARKENHGISDIDILVKFKSTLSLLQLVHVERLISEKLGIKVNMLTVGTLKNKIIKDSIEKDLKIFYQ
ncbi:MAG: nucleotidyltransferase domain-containing protein [Bacteroidota bacterium]